MPKSVNSLYEQIISHENIYAAYMAARRGKRHRGEGAAYGANLEENLINLHNHLQWQTWRPGKAREFRVFEPKQRDIQAPPFADRVAHHALVRVVEPAFERSFIHHSYACRKGKGAQRAVLAVQKMLRATQSKNRGGQIWVVKTDIKSYFASIRHDILFRAIERKVRCKPTLRLWRDMTTAYGYGHGVGVPVGALTSKLAGNIHLDQLDHAVTSGAGFGRYVRYMDDCVVITGSKSRAREALELIGCEAAALGLRLNPKSQIFPAHAGIDFAGYRTWSTHILPRKRNIKRARNMLKRVRKEFARGQIDLKEVRCQLMSYLAYAKHCNAHNTTTAILSELKLTRTQESYHEACNQ